MQATSWATHAGSRVFAHARHAARFLQNALADAASTHRILLEASTAHGNESAQVRSPAVPSCARHRGQEMDTHLKAHLRHLSVQALRLSFLSAVFGGMCFAHTLRVSLAAYDAAVSSNGLRANGTVLTEFTAVGSPLCRGISGHKHALDKNQARDRVPTMGSLERARSQVVLRPVQPAARRHVRSRVLRRCPGRVTRGGTLPRIRTVR